MFGGAIEPAEDAREALARELVEELGPNAAQMLLASEPALVSEHHVSPTNTVGDEEIARRERVKISGHGGDETMSRRDGVKIFRFTLFEAIVDDWQLDILARTPVLEGERGAVVTREQVAELPFVWDLEAVVLAYLGRL